MNPDPTKESIRIGTLAGKGAKTPLYIRQLIPHGFECFQINFWKTLGAVDLKHLAREVNQVLGESKVTISSLGIYGNPLGNLPEDLDTLKGWEQCIDNAHLFGTNLVCGFAGRVRGKSVSDSISRFQEVFGPLAQRAADKGVLIAFENCWMDETWNRGDWNIALSPDAWELMFDALPLPNIGLEWEPCHQLLELIDPLPQLRKWVPKIFHVHGKDATLYWDVIRKHGLNGPFPIAHQRHPGFGDTNWVDVISELRRGGFKGCIDIEGGHDPIYGGELEMTGQVSALQHLLRCRGGSFVQNPQL